MVERPDAELADTRRVLDAFSRVSHAIAEAPLELDVVLDTITSCVTEHVGDACGLWLCEPTGLTLLSADHRDPAGRAHVKQMIGALAQAETSVSLLAVKNRTVVAIADLDSTSVADSFKDEPSRAYFRAFPPRHAVAAPLRVRGQVLGALSLSRLAGAPPYTPLEQWLIEELAHRAAAAIDNAQLLRDARRAVQMRDEFLTIAGHELRTPLTSVLLQLESAAHAAHAPTSIETIQHRTDKALHQLFRLIRLVNSILDVTCIDAGNLRLEPSSFTLADAIDDVIVRFTDDITRAGCELEVHLDRSIVGVWDRFRVEQIVENLLSNAITYGARAPVSITLTATPTHAAIGVRDHGIGIAPADQVRIFQRFERAVSARNFGGLGLGLWIARHLALELGGTISVTSAPGSGALFELSLPLSS